MMSLLTNVLGFFIFDVLWKVSFALEPHSANKELLSRVGTDNFYDLVVSDGMFIDKSLLIDMYLRNKYVNIVITRPRRFGKTVNADMIRRFLEMTVNAKGQPEREEIQRNCKLFAGGPIRTESGEMKTLQPLKISYCRFSMEQQGYWPVVFVRFGQIRGNNSEGIEDSLREYFSRLFERYTYLIDKLGNDRDKELFESYRRGNAPREHLEHCLEFLTTRLRTYWNRKVHLIIDDYDVPVVELLSSFLDSKGSGPKNYRLQLFQDSVNSIEFKNTVKLVRDMLRNVLKDNPALEKSMVLGTLPIDEIISGDIGLKNFGRAFADFYGFSQSEIDNMLLRVHINIIGKHITVEWYGGYRNMGKVTYNAYSIMRCMQMNGTTGDYVKPKLSVGRSGGDKFIKQLLEMYEMQTPLAGRMTNRTTVRTHLDHINVKLSTHINCEKMFHFLHLYGYFTAAKNYEDTDIDGELNMPNGEIRYILRKSLLNSVNVNFGIDEHSIMKMAGMLRDGKEKECREALKELFLKRDAIKVFNSTIKP